MLRETTATTIAGTPGFQVPEKLRRENVTGEFDVYAVGGTLVEIFGGS